MMVNLVQNQENVRPVGYEISQGASYPHDCSSREFRPQ